MMMLDNAFWIEPRSTERVERILRDLRLVPGQFLAVTVRKWERTETEYIPQLAKTVDSLVPRFAEQAILVPNVFSPRYPNSGDRGLTRSLKNLLPHNRRVHVVDEDLTPEELASLYGCSTAILGTRLHSVILALAGGAPVVALSQLPKTRGVMSMLGLDDFVVDVTDFQHDRVVALVERAVEEQRHIPDMLARRRLEDDKMLTRLLRHSTANAG